MAVFRTGARWLLTPALIALLAGALAADAVPAAAGAGSESPLAGSPGPGGSEAGATVFEADPARLRAIFRGGLPGRTGASGDDRGLRPMPWLRSTGHWLPGTEVVQPDEIRLTFMGSGPLPVPGQRGTSLYLELGSGARFIFDLGPGALANYLAAGVPLNQLNDIFLTHLHWDHYGGIPELLTAGAAAGRWHEPLRLAGPSGRTAAHGVEAMVEHMLEMLFWQREAASAVAPVGRGFEVQVAAYDYRDDGGVIYQRGGVTIRHWRQIHGADGASGLRLDWNGLCVAFAGDGRPSERTVRHAAGCDVLVTDIQPDAVAATAAARGVLPLQERAALDALQLSAYGAGYLYRQVQPRLAVGTHWHYQPALVPELMAQVRTHWRGPFALGVPDVVVVNLTRDAVWVRPGVVPRYPGLAPQQYDLSLEGGLVIPAPEGGGLASQSAETRAGEIAPELYDPRAGRPEATSGWPTADALFVPDILLPEAWRVPPTGEALDILRKP